MTTLQEKIAAARARTAGLQSGLPSSVDIQHAQKPKESEAKETDWGTYQVTINGNTFNPFYLEGVGTLNAEQREAVKLFGLQGVSGCLIGPAGTGKTTTKKAIDRAIVLSGRVPLLSRSLEHKYLRGGTPGIWGGSFTRIATRNARDNTLDDLKPNVHTIHRLLEYQPVMVDVYDEEKKVWKEVRVFKPTRNKMNPLPAELQVFEFDEGSMVGFSLYTNAENAIGCERPQIIMIGDIAQLPPVMDEAILGYKMLEWPVIELKEVYRHAGVIVELANYIRTGQTIPPSKEIIKYSANLRKMPRKLVEDAIPYWNREEDGSKVSIHLWKNRLEGEVGQLRALQNLDRFFQTELKEQTYNPKTDMILMPYNKAVGTIEMNKYISQYLQRQRQNMVFEVIAGYQKWYLSVGDKLFYDREEAEIVDIKINNIYSGRMPQPAAVTLDRWGHNTGGKETISPDEEWDSIENLLNINVNDDEERKNQASHVIYIKKYDEEDEKIYEIKTAADVNSLIFGYALTIHKSQGSQWRKVYCVFHNSHNRNLQRELLYTAITRAQKELYVICEPETFVQGVLSQHIIGNTLAEKAEYFKGKIDANKKRDDLFNKEPA